MATGNKLLAIIGARSGSVRVPHKNIRELGGRPLLAHSIVGALGSGIFDMVMLSTDSEQYAEIGREYGAEVPFLRPAQYATAISPDIEFITDTLAKLPGFDFICLLRPTSPFRTVETIRLAWQAFQNEYPKVDALRAVTKIHEHPFKAWVVTGPSRMQPLLALKNDAGDPGHSVQYGTLPEIYSSAGSIDIVDSQVAVESGSLVGYSQMPFHSRRLFPF